MRVITISTDRYTKGREIEESVAQQLGYECVSREVILAAAKELGVPEMKILRTIKDTSSILGMFSRSRKRYMVYIKSMVASYMLKHDIVYHGLVGHPIIRGVSHVLKVRIIANLEDRVHLEMERESITEAKARKRIADLDDQQKKWGKAIYGIDITDPSFYDLVINEGHIEADDTEDAIETIVSTASHKKYQPNTYSINCMKNIELSCRIEAALFDKDPSVEVISDKGSVYVYTKYLKRKNHRQGLEFKEEIMKIEGVEHVEIYNDSKRFKECATGNTYCKLPGEAGG
ncbi:AAA family ATPase [Thermodesulfobacteriota bacterium]